MSRRKLRRAEDLERLREGFWAAEDSSPATVADTFGARSTYERDSLSSQVLDQVHAFMELRGITQQALAHELGVTEGRVSQILSGDQNLTLRTLAGLAAALKAHFTVTLEVAAGGRWETTPAPDGGGIDLSGREPGLPAVRYTGRHPNPTLVG